LVHLQQLKRSLHQAITADVIKVAMVAVIAAIVVVDAIVVVNEQSAQQRMRLRVLQQKVAITIAIATTVTAIATRIIRMVQSQNAKRIQRQ